MEEKKNAGFVLLHRRIRKSSIWRDLNPSVLKLALHYIMEARYQTGTYYDGQREVQVPIGSFVASIRKLAEDTGLSVKQIRTAQKHLENVGFGAHFRAQTGAHSGTLISVCNYETYQPTENTGAQTWAQTGAEKGHTRGTHKNKEKKENTSPPYSPPPQQPLELEPDRQATVGPEPSVTDRTPEALLERMIPEIARRMHGRHRRRKCSIKVVTDKLELILRREDKPADELRELLGAIDRCHEAMCASRDWCKVAGEYQASLEKWLDPSKRAWEVWPPDVAEPGVSYDYQASDEPSPAEREDCPLCGGRLTVDVVGEERLCRSIGCSRIYGEDPEKWTAAVAALGVTA